MTSKPTARERYQFFKGIPENATEPIELTTEDFRFLMALVEVAVFNAADKNCDSDFDMCAKDHTVEIWDEINQRMAEGEGKV